MVRTKARRGGRGGMACGGAAAVWLTLAVAMGGVGLAVPGCGEAGGGGAAGSAAASWGERGAYRRVLSDFVEAAQEAERFVEGVTAGFDVAEVTREFERRTAEFESLVERAKGLESVPEAFHEELREMAEPAIASMRELDEAVERLRRSGAGTMGMNERLAMERAAREVLRYMNDPQRDERRAARQDWFDEARERAEEERAQRDRERERDRRPRSFEERRGEMIGRHGAANVLTITVTECGGGVALRDVVERLKGRLGATEHNARMSGGTVRVSLAPVSASPSAAVVSIDLGETVQLDAAERWVTIRLDEEKLAG